MHCSKSGDTEGNKSRYLLLLTGQPIKGSSKGPRHFQLHAGRGGVPSKYKPLETQHRLWVLVKRQRSARVLTLFPTNPNVFLQPYFPFLSHLQTQLGQNLLAIVNASLLWFASSKSLVHLPHLYNQKPNQPSKFISKLPPPGGLSYFPIKTQM